MFLLFLKLSSLIYASKLWVFFSVFTLILTIIIYQVREKTLFFNRHPLLSKILQIRYIAIIYIILNSIFLIILITAVNIRVDNINSDSRFFKNSIFSPILFVCKILDVNKPFEWAISFSKFNIYFIHLVCIVYTVLIVEFIDESEYLDELFFLKLLRTYILSILALLTENFPIYAVLDIIVVITIISALIDNCPDKEAYTAIRSFIIILILAYVFIILGLYFLLTSTYFTHFIELNSEVYPSTVLFRPCLFLATGYTIKMSLVPHLNWLNAINEKFSTGLVIYTNTTIIILSFYPISYYHSTLMGEDFVFLAFMFIVMGFYHVLPKLQSSVKLTDFISYLYITKLYLFTIALYIGYFNHLHGFIYFVFSYSFSFFMFISVIKLLKLKYNIETIEDLLKSDVSMHDLFSKTSVGIIHIFDPVTYFTVLSEIFFSIYYTECYSEEVTLIVLALVKMSWYITVMLFYKVIPILKDKEPEGSKKLLSLKGKFRYKVLLIYFFSIILFTLFFHPSWFYFICGLHK